MKKLMSLFAVIALALPAVAKQDFPKPDFPAASADFPAASADFPAPANTQPLKAKVQAAVKQPASIPGSKRLITVQFEVQRHNDFFYPSHQYWYCPAVIFNEEGALAIDGECGKAFTQAANLPVGPVVNFLVPLKNFGEYTYGENVGEPFYFQSSYVAKGPGDDMTYSVKEAFKFSPDKSYIVFTRSLFNDPKNTDNPDNSEVKKAIKKYYQDNNLKEVTAETLSAYFTEKHPGVKEIAGQR